jgi:hypothetical protein
MRRTIALLVGAATVLVGAARPVAAAPGAPKSPAVEAAAVETAAPGPTVPSDAVDLTLSQVFGSGLAVTLDSGASEEHDIVVSNHTANLRLTIKLTATDATGKLGAAAASWLAFGDDAIQLDPHAAVTVPMTIAVPHDTQPGSALAHVSATVESAVSAADGSPVAGTASRTFPVSISVRGTATAQIAITDVHRIDQGSSHQLAVVLRNFGDKGAPVSGHVRVAGDRPQTLPFHADLPPSRDTTVDLGWDAPPAGSASDIAVDLEYGEGNVASWSSRLGGAPTDLSAQAGVSTTTPTTTLLAADPAVDSGSASAAKPWWKQPWALALALVAVLGAVSWFGFEMRATRRRRGGSLPGAVGYGAAAGWPTPPDDDAVDLAKQLVRLTEVIVQLVAVQRDGWEAHSASGAVADDRARARRPGAGAPEPDRDELQPARAGPTPPDIEPSVHSPYPRPEPVASSRSASPTAGDPARPDPGDAIEARFLDDEDEDEEGPEDRAPAVSTNLPTNLRAAQPTNLPTNLPMGPPTILPTNRRHGIDARVGDGSGSGDESGAGDSSEAGPANGTAALIQRLVDLDRERRRLREWMDAEDSGRTIEPPANTTEAGYRAGRAPGDSS